MSFVSGIISFKKNEENLQKFEKHAGNLKNYFFDGTERVKDNDFYLLKHFVVHRTEDQNKKHILYDSDTNNYFVIQLFLKNKVVFHLFLTNNFLCVFIRIIASDC